MYKIKKLFKITTNLLFVINFIFFSTLNAKNIDKYNEAKFISDYFSGILLLNSSKYEESHKFLKKLNGLENSHLNYSSKYLSSLINSGNFNLAFNYSNKLEKYKLDSFESYLIKGIYYLKSSDLDKAKNYFLKAKNNSSGLILNDYISGVLYIWSNLNDLDYEKAKINLDKLDNQFQNLKKIQNIFLNCYYNTPNAEISFEDLLNNDKTDFSRYNYFYANYLWNKGKKLKSKNIIKNSLAKNPRNLLLNQANIDFNSPKNKTKFNCKRIEHVAAEILYITANALSSQGVYSISNFYLNLAKYLNKDFKSFDILLAENFFKISDLPNAKKTYNNLSEHGEIFRWYAKKKIANILVIQGDTNSSIKLISKAYNNIQNKGLYETFEYAEFLKNNEEFKKSIEYYSKILKLINKEHPLFPEIKDGRGVAYERIGEWGSAEKDLLSSLEARPNQAYVINYLAYSWIEKGIKIEKSLKMLEKANRLKSNDPYIIDSLGWALFKLERFKEAKDYLQKAVKLMPADPIVNDHYGDVLWKNGKKIQARYYWNYVLNLEKTKSELKEQVKQKLVKGL